MQDKQRLAHGCDALSENALAYVVKKLLLYGEGPAGELHRGFPVLFNFLDLGAEIVDDMRNIGGRTDRRDRFDLRNIAGHSEHRRAAERMADQDRGGFVIVAHIVDRRHEVGNV